MRPQIISALFLAAFPLLAQLPAPNKAGVSAGHDLIRAKDLDAANKFWQTLGGQPVQFAGRLNLIKFPGVLLLNLASGGGRGRAGAPAPAPATPPPDLAGTEGSSIDFIGFSVKDLKGSLAQWAEAGIKPLPGGSATQVFLMTADKVKVRITEDKSLTAPIVSDTIGMMVPNVAEAQAWYAKNFGAEMIKHGNEMVANIPGSNILFEQAKGPVAPTRGRAFDRIGLEVVALDVFVKKLEDAGVKLDMPYTGKNATMNAGFAVFQDPFGTLIEMSDGLSAVK
jgi:catechol 2,3-dioxygenase-like lactoylglutathione lyase family enzyme